MSIFGLPLIQFKIPSITPPFLDPGQIWVDNGGIEFTIKDETA